MHAVSGAATLAPLTRVTHALVAYAVYLRKTIWPADLAPFYHYTPSLPLWTILGSAAVIIAISALLIYAGRERPYLAVGWLWFLGTLVPVIGLVQAGLQAWADRFMYVPLIGLAIHRLVGKAGCSHSDVGGGICARSSRSRARGPCARGARSGHLLAGHLFHLVARAGGHQ